jgi:hypothetical protein
MTTLETNPSASFLSPLSPTEGLASVTATGGQPMGTAVRR